ncbi:PKD domain-containing protein [Aridibaculum aurantiacum]|uniref:PKD domain-containing protein n=1 Tax=Aridibaculum aurantiacum TaxID=2810307 RepID=UPI001A96CD4A|nr:PKD domain-containing protein [Aridibaculum aurantiacum]
MGSLTGSIKSYRKGACTSLYQPAIYFFLVLILQASFQANAQVAPGIRANGRVMNNGDTLNICIGSTVNYQSTAVNPITEWKLKLGTPATYAGANPGIVTYNTAGIDSTIQKVINGLDTATMFFFIKVNDQKPVPDFTFAPNNECGNIPVMFNSSGTVSNGDPLKYLWTFEPTKTSTAANPTYQFLNAIGASGTSTYNVKLEVTNRFNCTQSVTKPVVIKNVPDASLGNPDNQVTFGNFNGVPTFRRCANMGSYVFQFMNASTTRTINTKYTINWGDGSPDSVFNTWDPINIITHPYTLGQHTLTLTVEGSTGCIGIKKYIIFLGTTPAGGFNSPGNASICAPSALTFGISGYANNTPGTTYSIAINDGSQGIVYQHPPPDSVTHVFGNGSCGFSSGVYGNAFSATLNIENPCGLTSVNVIPIYVSTRPRPNFAISPSQNVCTNTTVTFTNTSTSGSTITQTGGGNSNCNYVNKQVWSISPATGFTIASGSMGSINGSPTNNLLWTLGTSQLGIRFTAAGVYTIKMYVGNDLCGQDSIVKTICVRNPPVAAFTLPKKSSCTSDTINITNTSPTGGCLGDSYFWDVAYSDASGCNTLTGPSHVFVNNTSSSTKNPSIRFIKPGRYIISLTVSAIGTGFTCTPATIRDTFYLKAKPKVKINPINAVCIGNDILPTAVVTNCYADSAAAYTWTFSNGTPSTSNLAVPGAVSYSQVGSYPIILDVSNECGLTSDTVTALITSTPAANAGPDTSICSGVPVKFGTTGTAGLTYSWLPATGLSSATVASPTATLSYTGPSADTTFTYILTVAAGANCSSKDTVEILVKKRPIVATSPSAATICAGDSTTIASSGASSYSWAPITGIQVITTDTIKASPATTTTYTVTGTAANGCTNTATATITVVPYLNVNAGADTTVCNISTAIQLTGSPAGGTWSGHSSISATGIFNAATAGNGSYTLYYTAGNNNCNKTDSMVVTVIDPPVANAGVDTTVCQATTAIQLTGVPAGGRWSGSPLVTTTGSFTPSTPGIYTLIYTIGGGSCIGRDTVLVTVIGGIINNNINADQQICTGAQPATIVGSTASGGNGAPAYQWQSSTDNINWTNIAGATNTNYTPGTLTTTTWYRRISTTQLCAGPQANTSNVVKITVNPDARAEFNPTATVGCAPFFINSTVIGLVPYNDRVITYNWYVNGNYIGNGQTFPGYTMNTPGDSVTIKLVAISLHGCKNDSMQHGFVTVETPAPTFTQSNNIGCGPLTIDFTNTTANGPRYTYIWNFGQGQTSTLLQPSSIVFPTNPLNGDTTYTVTLKAISACDTITTTSSVTVRAKPRVLFTPDKTVGCSPMRVTFSNTSRGSNVTYTWHFDDGTAPLTTNNPSVQHTFTTGVRDTFYVKLVGTNDCGSDSLVYAIIANPNSIQLDFAVNGNQRYGCAPHTVEFVNNTTGANSFVWNFGDGGTTTTSNGIDTIRYTYTTAGNFNVSLYASNSCNDTTDFEPITVELKPNVNFIANPLVACVSDTIRFTNTSDNNIGYAWKFGDGKTSVARNPTTTYDAAGTYRVWLVGSKIFPQGFGCSDSAFADILIRDTLAGSFTASDVAGGCIPFTVTFKNDNRPSTFTTWNFGDGNTATGDNVTHTFTTQGSYTVTMISKGPGGCINKAAKLVTVTSPAGTMNYRSGYVCPGNAVRFEVTATNTAQIRYVFGDGTIVTTPNNVVFHQYTQPGVYVPHAYLIAGNCEKRIATGDTIRVDAIKAGFTAQMQQSCGRTTVQFNDTSRAYFGITNYQWLFGDGNSSTLQNPTHTYTQNGIYHIRLAITGRSGCVDTVTVPLSVIVHNYPAAVIGGDTMACTGQQVNFVALVQSQDSVINYNWSFGNNVNGAGKNVTTLYNAPGTYTVRLITTTINGCADTSLVQVRANVSPVVAAGADVRICRGQTAQLNAIGASTWLWNPLQDLSCSTCPNPVANPQFTTQYVVTGTNIFQCSATDTVLVEVVQPFVLTLSPNDTICTGQQTQLFASGASRYQWNPIAGLSSGIVANPIANPMVTTEYTVTARDPFNCFQSTASVIVAVGEYPTVNIGTGTTVVAGTQLQFDPVITNGPIRRYTWTPTTDLSCTNCPKPIATINNNITYKLEVENIYGCKGSDTIEYKIRCEEEAQVYIPNAFSPDGDGVNDIFMVRGKGLALVKYFRVFNRWGQLVFERSNFKANDPLSGWDGRVNGIAANADVYVYTAEMACTGGDVYVKKGNVTLVR